MAIMNRRGEGVTNEEFNIVQPDEITNDWTKLSLETLNEHPVLAFAVAKAMVTGSPPKVGEQRTLTDRELHSPQATREAR